MTEPREPTDQLGIGAEDMTDRTHPDSGFPIAYSHYANYAEYVEALHARIAELEAQLEAIGAGGVSGPLMGQPQEMPDLSALTERGAKAWAGVDAQGLRDGVTSVAASAPAPSGHIKEPYTVAEIKAKIASNDYSAELLLQHAMLHLGRLAASAGSEPVAYAMFADNGNIRLWSKARIPHPDAKPLYLHPSPPEGMEGGWMPIETAPKDGKLILVNFKSKGVRAVSWDSPFHDEVTEENGIWCVDDDKHGPYGLRGYNDDGPTAPTHWMPLPPPPTTSAGSGKGE